MNKDVIGKTITLSLSSDDSKITYFKMSGQGIEGKSFIMPEGNVIVIE